MYKSRNHLTNNILEDISRASQSNNATIFSEHLKLQLNIMACNSQTLTLEEKFAIYTERFNNSSDSIRACMLCEINCELDMLDKEEYNIANILDPSEMRGRHTFSRGGL